MKESTTQNKRTLGPGVTVQTVRLLPDERAHLEQLQKGLSLQHRRIVPFNEIMVKGLMGMQVATKRPAKISAPLRKVRRVKRRRRSKA